MTSPGRFAWAKGKGLGPRDLLAGERAARPVEFAGTVRRFVKASVIIHEGTREVQLPITQLGFFAGEACEANRVLAPKVGATYTISCPAWLARNEGLG